MFSYGMPRPSCNLTIIDLDSFFAPFMMKERLDFLMRRPLVVLKM